MKEFGTRSSSAFFRTMFGILICTFSCRGSIFGILRGTLTILGLSSGTLMGALTGFGIKFGKVTLISTGLALKFMVLNEDLFIGIIGGINGPFAGDAI